VEQVVARHPKNIVDIGTGSACIAVALAKRLPAAEITAIDASAEALEVAQANAKSHDLEKMIRFLKSDLLENFPDGQRVDAVVSNPPYIASGELARLPKEVRDFEPVPALIAGEDGLEVFRRLAKTAKRVLSPSGFVALEMGAGQRAPVEELFSNESFAVAEVLRDLQGIERVIVAQPK
jgi:release factor glutamine methyltransferase